MSIPSSAPLQYLPRLSDAALERAMATSPIVLVDGPRAVGKTTSAARLAASALRLPKDFERLTADPEATLRDLARPVLIDEWQLAGIDLLWTLKEIVDADPTPGQFLLAGSVEPATYGPTFPLTGRATRVVMRPMNRAELEGHGAARSFLERTVDGERPQPTAGRRATFSLDTLSTTGFPAARELSDPVPFLEGYAALIAQRAGDEGRDASRLLTTLRVLATLEAQAVPAQRVWDTADINKVTWANYEDLLARTHITSPSSAYESNRLARLTTYPKRYLADTALALALAGITPTDLKAEPSLAGRYLESYVMQQLRPQVDAVGGSLLHLRTGAGEHEVDAIVAVGLKIFAFEVKLGTRPTERDAKHLSWLRDNRGDAFTAGFVVHTGGDTFSVGDRIWAIPVSTLIS